MERRPVVYRSIQWTARLLCVVLWRFRFHGFHNVPPEGGLIVVANHQSFLDLALLGSTIPRNLIFLARGTLRGSWIYRALTFPFDILDLRRGEGDVGAFRAMVERLREGRTLLVFPEGTRSRTGSLGELSPGFLLLAARSGAKVVAARVSGAFTVWPRGRLLPGRGSIRVDVSRPLELAGLSRDQALDVVREHLEGRRLTRRDAGV